MPEFLLPPLPSWAKEAYELGRQGNHSGLTDKALRRVLFDETPSNRVKWWRRGFRDRAAALALYPPDGARVA